MIYKDGGRRFLLHTFVRRIYRAYEERSRGAGSSKKMHGRYRVVIYSGAAWLLRRTLQPRPCEHFPRDIARISCEWMMVSFP